MSVAEKMTELADAVRDLTGGTDPLTLDDMIQSIRSASTSDIINTAEGNPIYLTDCTTRKLHGLTLYGKTVQNGTPSPLAPVALDSLGDSGNITVHVDEQMLEALTPNGLPGIPVANGGNYTDAAGQQWVCDEIDFARGKYVQRIGRIVFDGSDDEGWGISTTKQSEVYRYQSLIIANTLKAPATNNDAVTALATAFPAVGAATIGTYGCIEGISASTAGTLFLYCNQYNTSDVAIWKNYLAANPMTVLYELAAPIETNLTAEELASYTALHTSYPQTAIYNDEGAWMTVKYAAVTTLSAV